MQIKFLGINKYILNWVGTNLYIYSKNIEKSQNRSYIYFLITINTFNSLLSYFPTRAASLWEMNVAWSQPTIVLVTVDRSYCENIPSKFQLAIWVTARTKSYKHSSYILRRYSVVEAKNTRILLNSCKVIKV